MTGQANLANAAIKVGHYEQASEFIQNGMRLSAKNGYARGTPGLNVNKLELDWLVGEWNGLTQRAQFYLDAWQDLPQFSAHAQAVSGLLFLGQRRRAESEGRRSAHGELALELERSHQLRAEAGERRLANLRQSAEVATLPPRGKTREHIAAWACVSARTVQDAATVQEHDPDLFQRVKAGDLAADLAARRVRRTLRDQALPQPELFPEGPFQLIYADPPWQLGNPDGRNAPERHYPTMPLADICAIPSPAAEDAVLLVWAVNCLLPEALQVIEAWDFTYKTNLVWVKPSIGLGNWARNRHELLLLATRGHPPLPEAEARPDSVIEAPRTRHSQKPTGVYELIERAWPQASKLELFARTARPGWAAWGNQLEAA